MAVADIISGIQLLKDLVEWIGDNRTKAVQVTGEDPHFLHYALSTIHFDDRGILSVLRAVADGAEIRPAHRSILLDFHYAGPEVGIALLRLEEAFSDAAGLSIKQRKALRGLIPLKSEVRAQVGRLFAEETGFGTDVAVSDVANLVARIEHLNMAIESVDETLPR